MDTHKVLENETIEEAIGFEDDVSVSADDMATTDPKYKSGNGFS